MSATLATVDAILKEFYVDYIAEQLNQETKLLQTVFRKSVLAWNGKYVVVPVHLSRNTGVGFVAELGTLPTPGAQGYEKYNVFAKYLYGTGNISGPTLSLGNGSIGITSAFTGEVDGLINDTAKSLNRALFFGGRAIGFVWQKQNAAIFQFAGNDDGDVANQIPTGVGETVGFYRMDTFAQVGANTQLNSISTDINGRLQITLNANINTSAVPTGVPMVVIHNNPALTSRVTGMIGNLADPDQFGLSRATYDRLRCKYVSGDAWGAFSTTNLQTLFDSIAEETGRYPQMVVCHPRMRSQYTNALVGTSMANYRVNITSTSVEGDGGVAKDGVMSFNDVPFLVDPDAPKGIFFALTTAPAGKSKGWCWAEAAKGDFVRGTTENILLQDPTTDTYSFRWRLYGEAYCDRPNANGVYVSVQY